MQQYVSLRINGSRITAPKGTSVLDAALSHGICIPHLCHVPGLTDFGGCRLCIVEIVRNGRSKITTSCTLEVQQDMVVRSDTDRVRRYRKNIAELLVAEAPNSRAIQDLAARCGVQEVRYPFRNEKCVLCGRCVRVCEEIFGRPGRSDSWEGAKSATWTSRLESGRISARSAGPAWTCAP